MCAGGHVARKKLERLVEAFDRLLVLVVSREGQSLNEPRRRTRGIELEGAGVSGERVGESIEPVERDRALV